jgi:hypothetical protein
LHEEETMKLITNIVCILLFSNFLFTGCRDIFGDDTQQPVAIVQPPTEGSKVIVTEPVLGMIKNPGDIINISWIAPTINKIDIQLFRKNEFKFNIIADLDNNGNFEWKIPYEIPLSNHYLIKIISHANSDIYKFSDQFGIQ